MIDLDQAAQDLTASVAHIEPDLGRVQHLARRHRQRRRLVGAAAMALLVVAGMAAAAAMASGQHRPGHERVRAGDPPAPALDVHRVVDHSGMRIIVPKGWAVVGSGPGDVPANACSAPGRILVGYGTKAPAACADQPSITLAGGGGAGAGSVEGGGGRPEHPDATRKVNGYREFWDAKSGSWSLPDLDGTIVVNNGADADPILDSLTASARWVAIDDSVPDVNPPWARDPDRWRPVRLGNVVLQVPRSWRWASGTDGRGDATGPCDQWHDEGPTVRVDVAGGRTCDPARPWQPVDGVWMLPTAASDPEGGARDMHLLNRNGVDLTVTYDLVNTVLQVKVPDATGKVTTLVRIGLGVDGHLAGGVLSSIEVLPDAQTGPLVLPCGAVASSHIERMNLPGDLDVPPEPGLGGAPGRTEDGRCSVHFTSRRDPARRITFSAGHQFESIGPFQFPGPRHVQGRGYSDQPEQVGATYDSTTGDPITVTVHGGDDNEIRRLFQAIAER